MDQYSQHNLKKAATEPQHAVRKSEFDSVTNSIRSDLQSHGHSDLAPKANPTLTGTPKAPTAAVGTNTTQIATTAFVTAAVAGKANTSHLHATAEITGLDTALAGKAALTHSHTTAQITGLDATLAAKANLASPSFTGIPIAPTAAAGTNSTQLATTSFVTAAVAGKANTSHTHTLSQISDAATKANLASPAFTGTPSAPTAAATTNSTQIATTAFVKSQGYVPDLENLGGGTGSSTVRILRNVAALALPSSAPKGTVKITIPVTWTVAMFNIELSGFIYGAPSHGPWKMFLGGCNHSSGPAWQYCSAFNAGGRLPFTSVRFGHDGTNVCILLGTTASTWPYSSLCIDKVFASYSGAASVPKSGWKIELITTETGITNIVTATINDSTTLNGVPTAPTAASTVNNTQIATTAFVQAVAATKAATSHSHTTAQVANLDTALAAKAPLASPALTGNPTAPTQAAGNNSTRLATTAFVTTAIAGKANTSHTHTLSQITDASTKANLASPAFTGTPTAPTAASTVNSTQIATTAFVKSLLGTSNLQFKLMSVSTLNSTYVNMGVTPKLIIATFYSTFSGGEYEYKTGYVYFYTPASSSCLQTDQCSSIYNPGALQVSGTSVRSTGWWSSVNLLIFY